MYYVQYLFRNCLGKLLFVYKLVSKIPLIHLNQRYFFTAAKLRISLIFTVEENTLLFVEMINFFTEIFLVKSILNTYSRYKT